MSGENERCPVCGSSELTPHRLRSGLWLVECRGCAVFFRIEAALGTATAPAWASPASERAKDAMYREGLARLAAAGAGRRVLDVGCGYGTFLDVAAAAGWRPEGVEPEASSAEAARARGRAVHVGTLDDYAGPGGFDAVTLWDVLEAMPDPVRALRRARELLKPGGALLVRTRNAPVHLFVERELGRLLGLVVRAPATFHRFGFGSAALRGLFERTGLQTLWIENSPLTAGDPYGSGRVGAWATSALKAAVSAAARLVELATGGRLRIGTTLWALARKPREQAVVLHLITRLDPGGSSESTLALVRGWKDERTTLELLAGPGEAPPPPPVAVVGHLYRSPSWRDLLALWEIYRVLRRRRPDVLHTHSSKAGVLGRLAGRLAGVPRLAHTPHGHVFYGYFGPAKSALYLALERLCAGWTDAFLALTEGEKRESVERGLGEAERWVVAPSGTPLPPPPARDARAARRRLGLEEDALWVGSLLRLEHVKGPDLLVEAAGRLRDRPELRFALVGDGPMRKDLEARARYLGLGPRIVFAGHRSDIWDWLGALDVYVQPSRNEAMGRTLVQAQAAGLPVVATTVCGIPDVARAGDAALLVPPEDPRALADAILELASDPARRRSMGENGRAFVYGPDEHGRRRFSPEAMVHGHKLLYERLLGDGVRAPKSAKSP